METGVFLFKPISKNGIIGAIEKIPSNKSSISNEIPVSVMKQFANCYCKKQIFTYYKYYIIFNYLQIFWTIASKKTGFQI